MNIEQFGHKVDNEGGLYEAVISYGLSEKDLDSSTDARTYFLIKEYVRKAKEVAALEYDLEDILWQEE